VIMNVLTAENSLANVQRAVDAIRNDEPQRFPEAASPGDTWRQGDLYIELLDQVPDGALFTLEGGNRRIEVKFEKGYPAAQLFAPHNDDVVGIEPMTAPTDSLRRGSYRYAVPGKPETVRFSVAGPQGSNACGVTATIDSPIRELYSTICDEVVVVSWAIEIPVRDVAAAQFPKGTLLPAEYPTVVLEK